MSLSTALYQQFTKSTRQKGMVYFGAGRVKISEGGPDYVVATVTGSDIYHADATLNGANLEVYCTCPYFEDRGDPCKHIWAMLLAADRAGHLGDVSAQAQDIDVVPAIPDAAPIEDDFHYERWPPSVPLRTPSRARKPKAKAPAWQLALDQWRRQTLPLPFFQHAPPPRVWPESRRLVYVIEEQETRLYKQLVVATHYQDPKKNGQYSKPKKIGLALADLAALADPMDKSVALTLFGTDSQSGYYSSGGKSTFWIPPGKAAEVVALLAAADRLYRRPRMADLVKIRFDSGPPWTLALNVQPGPQGKDWVCHGSLRRGEETLGLERCYFIAPGLILWDDQAAGFDDAGVMSWIEPLSKPNNLFIPHDQTQAFLKELAAFPTLPALNLPPEWQITQEQLEPKIKVIIKSGPHDVLEARLVFLYGDKVVNQGTPGNFWLEEKEGRLSRRHGPAELAAEMELRCLLPHCYPDGGEGGWIYQVPPKRLASLVQQCSARNWQVEAQGKLFRQPGQFNIEVTSGIDWFDLSAVVDYDGQSVPLPRLLEALKRGENTVVLDDGTVGMLPEAWLAKYGFLAGLGRVEGDQVRFRANQIGFLDALLAAQPETRLDAAFTQARKELASFAGIAPLEPAQGFAGELRGYQKEGLGWLDFLQRFGFGGCLADDMGLGKTVQVLAMLQSRRHKKKAKGPALIVVPRSLVFNWKQEAARFTASLRVLDHTGLQRARDADAFAKHDIVLTTYGTLRRDIAWLKDVEFDYCVLDESQAIKNAASDSAKAARLVQARLRLALSGTPIENHLGELWSLFDFLNPGMLNASVFRLAGGNARQVAPETRAVLAQALRPFILRRTKDQVAKDLPARTDQVIHCELEGLQRQLYDELRDHYRLSLLQKVDKVGIKKVSIQVLEALLRLRQAACHPGLIDKKLSNDGSAKLDAVLPLVREVLDEGHKALVFSQFTSLLSIVRQRLDDEDIPYEYLDGKTRDRGARVERFQSDPECRLFLLSLKAGGVGLNLTAAEYVFLLDPWWNPAVEAQAIDRTHRIGQTKPVFAYRLIAKDTVEDKVLALQQSKRELAEAILDADHRPITDLRREDLEILLS